MIQGLFLLERTLKFDKKLPFWVREPEDEELEGDSEIQTAAPTVPYWRGVSWFFPQNSL